MARQRRKFSSALKAHVAIEAARVTGQPALPAL
jgi:hypothetical protein